jgi:hypothetical protein
MAKRRIENYVFSPGMSYKGYVFQDAYDLLVANEDFIIAEAIAYISQEIALGNPPFDGYTYNTDKCRRDIGFILTSYKNDLRYGGNQKLNEYASRYWENGVSQLDGDRLPEVAVHTYLRNLITDYIFTNTSFSRLQFSVAQTIDLSKTVTNYSLTPTAATYAPSTGNMTLTVGSHNLSVGDEIFIAEGSLVFRCALDGYATDHPYPRSTGVPNVTGHDPYWDAPIKITAITDTTITVNVGISSDTSTHQFISASANAVTYGASNKIDVLANRLVDIIENGLSKLPATIKSGYGYIKVQGKYNLAELLLITNNSKNEVIFNFTNNDTGAVIEINNPELVIEANDADFPKYNQTTDGVTKLKLNFDTSAHDSTDDIQIFVEEKEVRTRPYDFGTDAIERMRIAPPLSMLDADFEYGLQPTKWSAIGMMRGYPSIYEVPGSEKNVSSVVTDASAGTGGVGQSLITVTTVTPHGLQAGNPITIKALENSIAGAARAEGAFIIITVPSDTTFTYYAKAKVGTVDGDVLSTTYTQLREGGFYTGSNISVNPTFSVVSNGFSGSMVAELQVGVGSTRIPYDGDAPELGAPLSNSGIPTGAQVTQTITQSSGGGTYLSANIVGDWGAGTNSLEVDDATGIITGLALDRGDGQAIFVSGVVGTTITFDGNFSSSKIGNTTTYNGLSGSNVNSVGFDAQFDISIAGGVYTIDSISGGESYEVGDRIVIPGDQVGGLTPANDLTIVVTGVISLGTITSADVEGTAFNGIASIPGLQPEVNGGLGFSASFDIEYTNNSYTAVTIANEISEAYEPYDIIQINGDQFSGGSLGTNDAFVTVQTVDSIGRILTATVTGTAPDADVSYESITSASYVYSGTTGSGAIFNVTRTATAYSATFTSPGTNYLPTETITIDGADLGGVSTTNDCVITIDNVDGGGGITAISVSGTAANTDTKTFVTGSNLIGSGAEFSVDISGGSYSVTVSNSGQDYGVNQTFTIPGSQLAGIDITNDLTITILTLADPNTRDIATVNAAGSASTGTGTFLGVAGTNEAPIGTGALFDVIRNNGVYTISLASGGEDYKIGNRIVLLGTQLGGSSPINDITIFVDTLTVTAINTFTSTYEEAVFGDIFDLIATVTISEATTGLIPRLDPITFTALASIEVTFPNAHGLVPGSTFIASILSDDTLNNHDLCAGSFIATQVPTLNTLTYNARAAGNIDTASADISGNIYPRPDSFFVHRPYDGGVQLGTGGPQHGAQAIRQSKNYIRYQSGKGIMYTTGALFAPSYDLRSVTASGTEVGSTITIVTDDNDHGLQIGGVIRLIGVETEGYNSGPETYLPPSFDYTVTRVVDERTFEVLAQRRLGSTTAKLGFAAQMSVVSWHGATVRSGIFDDQNGIFWEYDGTQLSVTQRTGTKQIAGTIAMEVDYNLVTGTNTRFRDQLKAGDRIIIKGMTHVVSQVIDQTSMTVTPDFRGVTDISGTKAMLITDKKVKQSDFNLDRMDGTGPSGYDFDHAKMQMIGIQYSWYGAGFIDFMVRGADGNFVFAHRMRNSNVNTEAFMRSGNLPVRYEVTNEGPLAKLVEDVNATQTTIPLDDSSFFPDTGTIYIDNEIIRFTGNDKSANTLTGATRGSTLENFQAGAVRAYSAGVAATHSEDTGVVLVSNTITPLISHWGSAFITDGGFDEDRGYIFSYTESDLTVSTTKQTAFLIRLAPSVSNAITGDLGERELLNRAQLLLQGIEVTSDTGTGGIVVEGVLNPQNYPTNPNNVGWGGLTSVAQGGQPSFAQVASGGSVEWTTGVATTTTTATQSAALTAQLDSGIYNSSNRNSYVFVNATDYRNTFGTNSIAPVNGLTITGSAFASGTQITGGRIDATGDYGYFFLNRRLQNNLNSGTSNAMTITFGGSLSGRNFMYATKASLEASGATIGTPVTDGGTVTFPANSSVTDISSESFAGTEYYRVQFNNSFSGTLTAGSGTVEFTFEEPPFAQPGETVFSFIAVPGERSVLDLAQLKELTNTTLGGRGTFPNGPDVLAINVYKTTGTPVTGNIILRWGEAQA